MGKILSRFPMALESGAELNFSVAGYASDAAIPAAADENTIAIITTTPMSGYQLSSEEPEKPDNGYVWIETAARSNTSFSVLNDAVVMVYPSKAHQYVAGKWVDVVAKTYQGGAWRRWNYMLYDEGVQHVEWIAKTSLGTITGWPLFPPTFSENTMDLAAGGNGTNTACGVVTKNKVDITGYSKLFVEFVEAVQADGANSIHVHITDRQTENWEGANSIATAAITAATQNVELPFTGSGLYYIDIHLMRAARVSIKRIYLQ